MPDMEVPPNLLLPSYQWLPYLDMTRRKHEARSEGCVFPVLLPPQCVMFVLPCCSSFLRCLIVSVRSK